MLIISLNICHHLTHQAVALLTDSIHAKEKKKGKGKARLSSFSVIHPFFPIFVALVCLLFSYVSTRSLPLCHRCCFRL